MLLPLVIARLKDQVPALRSVGGALELTAMLKANALPAQTGAHVVPIGIRGGAARDVTGGFIQELDETVGVVLTFRNTNAAEARAAGDVDTILTAVMRAIAGWQPAGYPNVFRLVSGRQLTFAPGTFVYSLDFALAHQLRIL